MLRETLINLINEGYDKERLEIQMQKTYHKYKNNPYFILECNKYKDFNQIMNKIKNNIYKKKMMLKNIRKILQPTYITYF